MTTRNTFVLAMLTVLGACSASDESSVTTAAVPAADLVLRGGTIASVDNEIGLAQAIAVNGHRITAIGSNDDIAPYIDAETRVIELEGRFAMPGFIEGHGHFLGYGRAQQILDLTTVRNWDEVVSMVANAADKVQPGEWILGRGWHQDKWDSAPDDAVQGSPRNDGLTRAAPDNPVMLTHASGHAAIANDAALRAGGIDDDTADPDGGTIVRDTAGVATGVLREYAQAPVGAALQSQLSNEMPEESEQNAREQVYLAGEAALSHGITSFHDAGTGFADIDFLRLLEREGALPIRLYVMVGGESAQDMQELLPHYLQPAEDNDFLVVRSIKQQIDGALGTHGAWLLEPYADMPDTSGLTLQTVAHIEETARLAVDNGYQVAVHAIGDRANRETLDLYERVWQEKGVEGNELRWRVEHAQHIQPADVPRFAALGVIASVQGVHSTSDGPWIPDRLGEARANETSYPWKDLFDSGAIVNNGTDVPVESTSAIASFYSSVARVTRDGTRFVPEQAMTREQALRSYTINNAIAAFEEDQKGSLVPGKFADIVVLSQNLLTVAEQAISDTVVEMTIIGGEVAYTRAD